ncbi:MAG: hypothetical protein R3A51_02810 [Nannocystaceae bacterium]|nr:hypothetical protein [Myxococcales bacterium]
MRPRHALFTFLTAAVLAFACAGDPNHFEDENVGLPCGSAADCYVDINPALIRGDILCMDKVPGGYCTHYCETDADCCAVDGECLTDHRIVCTPYENDKQKRCMLACEAADLYYDDYQYEGTEYCTHFLSEGWNCSSSGGGSENRDICKPN